MSIPVDDHGLPVWLQRQLKSLLQQRGHALLLSGPPGLGQYSLALSLARAWLCDQPDGEGACGQCESCHAIDVRTHPDLCVLMPETLAMDLGWPLDEKTQDRIDKKEVKASRWIRVDAARDAVAFTQYTRSRGNTKVVLIFPADRLNVESANTLLKTLEEPSGAVRFVLATEAAHSLLPTIRSRCQSHPMEWPSQAEAMDWLQGAQHADASLQLESSEVAIWLRAAGGRPDAALEWMKLGMPAASWRKLPYAVANADLSLLADWPVARQMEVLQKLCHDLMALSCGGQPRFFDPSDLPPSPGIPALVSWQHDLLLSARTMEHPFSAALLQEAWIQRARSALAVHSEA